MAHEIVYFSYSMDASVDVPGQEDIFAVDPESGAVRRLTDDSSGLEFVSDRDPRWSPDRTRVAIHRAVSDSAPSVVVLDAVTGTTVAVVGEGVSPIWLDDERLAFVAPHRPNLVLTSTLAGEMSTLLELPEGAFVAGMDWHPEQGLAFGFNDPGENPGMVGVLSAPMVDQAITTQTPSGSDAVVLVGRIGAGTILPAWRPDGEALAVSVYNPATWSPDDTQIGILDLAHRTYVPIPCPRDGLINVSATWSPDGGSVAFCRGDEDRWSEIWRYEVATGSLRQVTDSEKARFIGSPDW